MLQRAPEGALFFLEGSEPMAIDQTRTVLHVARLARLELREDEVERLRAS